jgi:hypothetical protein
VPKKKKGGVEDSARYTVRTPQITVLPKKNIYINLKLSAGRWWLMPVIL